MPSFVPVEDVETPRNERDANDPNMKKHRQWDSGVIARSRAEVEAERSNTKFARKKGVNLAKGDKNPATDRGWAMGTVGWGVLGAFGSHRKDEGAQIQRRATGKNKMVRNEKGLWVKAKELDHDAEDGESVPDPADGGEEESHRRVPRGRGRGGGVPLLPSDGPQSHRVPSPSKDKPASDQSDSDSESSEDSSSESRESSRDRQSSRRRKQDSRDRHTRKRSDSRDRRTRSRRDDSRDRQPRRRDSRDRRPRRDDRKRRHSSEGRRRDANDASKRRHQRQQRSAERQQKRARSRSHESPSKRHEKSRSRSPPAKQSSPPQPEEPPMMVFNFTAAQVVERLCEVYGGMKKPEPRVNAMLECMHEGITLRQLNDGQPIATIEALSQAWRQSGGQGVSEIGPAKRLYIEANGFKETFCVDFYVRNKNPGLTLPGLFPLTGSMVCVYRVEQSKITNIWVDDDDEGIAFKTVDEESLQSTRTFLGPILEVLCESYGPDGIDTALDLHFNDYGNIPVIG